MLVLRGLQEEGAHGLVPVRVRGVARGELAAEELPVAAREAERPHRLEVPLLRREVPQSRGCTPVFYAIFSRSTPVFYAMRERARA